MNRHSSNPPIEQGIRLSLSAGQREAQQCFRAIVAEEVSPHAGQWDRQGEVPLAMIERLRELGWLGAIVPPELGGGGLDALTYGLLTEEIGRGCSSLRSLLTVHDMVTLALLRWASAEVKATVVPSLGSGRRLAALALSEPNVGSDAVAVETLALRDGEEIVLEGRKKWITFGEIADELLVLARLDDQPTAFLVAGETPGLTRRPLRSVVGTRASRLAEIHLEGCRIPLSRQVGRVGGGVSHVFTTALDHGRYSVAWGAVGIAQACLDACLAYAGQRRQGGALLIDHQLIRRTLTEMIAATRAARLLCLRAGWLRAERDPGALAETMVAKYFASRTAVSVANDAVQLHGANGLCEDYPVERYLRDAKVTEIIEGSTEIQQITIPRLPLDEI
ncbi:MAG TPA: acyl-CoA dehydrogenase family protein [Thermoanaerobaculia bacterium]|nr:acyl-CoA dehydrogenase family protein [Thermoanaerobaculia bacterium]